VNAAELLVELEAAGVRLSLAGNDLHFQTRPGVSIAPYADRIREHKPALRRELLQRQIVAAVTVEPERFNRPAYDALWVRWHAQDAMEQSTACGPLRTA
jgi:hypothetical protein